MITHTITRHVRPQKEIVRVNGKHDYPKFHGIHGTTDHRKYLLKRALHINPFSIYDEVIYRKRHYIITDIYSTFELVSWSGLSPKFIELNNADNEYQLVNPGDIRKVKRR